MSKYEKKYRVNCPFSNRPEYVYVHTAECDGLKIAAFAGCDNSYHKCIECDELCKAKVQKLFDQESCVEQQLRGHPLEPGSPGMPKHTHE